MEAAAFSWGGGWEASGAAMNITSVEGAATFISQCTVVGKFRAQCKEINL